MRRAVVLLALAAWGCGSGSPGAPEPRVDPDALASCMVKLSGSPLFDPLQVRLSAALRTAVRQGRRRAGSVLPRPGGFAAFAGANHTFAPAGSGSSAFAPAAFVFFADAAAAREHEGDADERHGNLLIVYDGRPSAGETTLVSTCLHKAGG